MLKNQSIVCFGGEDWWYHHPHSKAHLMRRFARAGNKVIFVNSISMGLPSLANKDFLPRIKRKLKSYAKLARTSSDGITVISPATIPFYGNSLVRWINQILLVVQIRLLMKWKKMGNPILWIAIPTAAQVIGKLGEKAVIYQVSDKYDANMEDHSTNPATIRSLHEYAIEKANLVFYSGRKLFSEVTKNREKSYWLEQGVDYEHWSRIDGLNVAPEIEAIPHPRLGYFGAIEPWLIDQELIKLASKIRPEWHWIFIGNLSRGTDLAKLKNVHFFARVDYETLPHYAAGFDVCVLPWETEHSFTNYGSAIKVREYMATGKPVVIAPLPEYENICDALRIARNRDEFIKMIESALKETDTNYKKLRQATVQNGTWDARAEWVSNLIEKECLQRDLIG